MISPDGVSALINVYKTFDNDYDVQLIFSQAEQRLKVNDKILCANSELPGFNHKTKYSAYMS